MVFADRAEAGRQLAVKLERLRDEHTVVLGVPRGGVAVAHVVAAALAAPLDVVVVRKLGVPGQPELGMGAVGEGGVLVVNETVLRRADVDPVRLAAVEGRERGEVEARLTRLRGDLPRIPVAGRSVIVVDDGIATGSTMRAACQVVRRQGARRVVAAAPVAPHDVVARLREDADEVVCVRTPRSLRRVSRWYDDFAQTSDDEVTRLLDRAREGRRRKETRMDNSPRVEELISQMTPVEKAAQLTQYFYFRLPAGVELEPAFGLDLSEQPKTVEAALREGGAGSLLFVRDAAETNRLQRLAVEGSRLGIPLLFGFDVVHGLRTILPVPIAMAASWDPDTIERGQAVAACEARAVGIHWSFAPMVDVARDPRWGRIVESAGEDPYLGAAVAAAQVRGFQGADPGAPDRVLAGPKHFAGYGGAVGGRDYDEVDLSDSELWNVYLPPFKAAVEAGAGNVMTAYMDLNGIPATGNRWLFTDVLREAWGFEGFVVSDANAVRSLSTHGFAAGLTDAAARAVNAGVDMEMAMVDPAYALLPEALESGAASEEAVDASVRRVLEAKLRMGLFDAPYVDEDRAREILADPAHREEARIAAERSAVLLRNDGDLLPLDADGISSIAVIGPLADSKRDTLGPWVFDFDLDETVTVLDGIRAELGEGVRVEYSPGIPVVQRVFPSMFDMWGGNRPSDPDGFDEEAEFRRAVGLAREADVAVVVAGEWQNMIGEAASRSSLELPGRQLELLQAVVETGTPVVLLVMNGRPLDLRWAAEHVPAILDIWYPGTQGGAAVANLLFGDVSPGGKLPFTWPRTVGQVPLVYSHTHSHEPVNQGRRYWDEASTPLFPFGHGLSYARFEYSNLVVDRSAIAADETVTVSVEVANQADREADEVVQLYIHQRYGSASRPVRELKGFRRVTLGAGESRRLRFPVGPEERRYWNAAVRDWVIDASTFDVWVGGDSTAVLATTFEVTRA